MKIYAKVCCYFRNKNLSQEQRWLILCSHNPRLIRHVAVLVVFAMHATVITSFTLHKKRDLGGSCDQKIMKPVIKIHTTLPLVK